MSKQKPKTMAEAYANLGKALHELAVSFAALAAEALVELQRKGYVDATGKLTAKGRKLLKDEQPKS